MRPLAKNDGDIHIKWSSGCGRFFEHGERPWKIWTGVYCRLHNFPEDRIAMLDTAAEWSMVGGELAEELWSQLGEGEYFEMHARGHLRTGELRKCNVTLRADNGDDLTFEGTIFVSMDWTGPIVLGYHGLFENIRFALDPGLNSEQQRFYFGSCE